MLVCVKKNLLPAATAAEYASSRSQRLHFLRNQLASPDRVRLSPRPGVGRDRRRPRARTCAHPDGPSSLPSTDGTVAPPCAAIVVPSPAATNTKGRAPFCTICCVYQTAMLDQFRERRRETLNGILASRRAIDPHFRPRPLSESCRGFSSVRGAAVLGKADGQRFVVGWSLTRSADMGDDREAVQAACCDGRSNSPNVFQDTTGSFDE